MANVNHVRAEVADAKAKWELIDDCLGGSEAVKKARTKYLPMPNPDDVSAENLARYNSFLARAVFYNVTRRTLDGLSGQVFQGETVIELPSAIKILEDDADGSGVTLKQQAKKTLDHVLSRGRVGVLVDYPVTESIPSKADQDAGEIRPSVVLYAPGKVINWRTTTVGAKKKLSLVVLEESHVESDDGFKEEVKPQYRVLRLEDGIYKIEIWREDGGEFREVENYYPLDHAGKNIKEIPFAFVGSENNDPEVDYPPLYDLAELNIAHYVNSASWEWSCFMVGEATPWVSGVTRNWLDEVMGGQLRIGSSGGIPLPEGAAVGMLQAEPNTLVQTAMEMKERQMVALGAKLVEQREVQRTLGEARLEEASEVSVLASAASNVEAAYNQALEWAMLFTGGGGAIKFELDKEFEIGRMSPQERQQLIAEWQAEAISYTEMRDGLRRANVATIPDDKAKEEIEANPPGFVPGNTNDNRIAEDGDEL